MKTFPKLTLAALLATGLLLLSACTAESSDTPTTVASTTAPTPSVTTTAVTTTDNPVVTTTPQVTTTQQTPATSEPMSCAHDYTVSEGEPSCTSKATIHYTCTKCGDSYSESVKALGHNYVNGTCTNCRRVNLLTLSGDGIMDLIKADGCPEDKLIYGFDTEVGADELAKIEEFLIYSDASWIFSIFAPTFYDPTEVSLYGILYDSTSYSEVTEAERKAYYEHYGMSPELQEIFSPHKLTTAEIENYLMTYLGIPFTDEMKAELASQALYLKKYDAYYKANTDSATNTPQYYPRAWRNADGYILVVAGAAENTNLFPPGTAIILVPNGDGYRIVMSVDILPTPTAEEQSLPEQMASMGCPEELIPTIERRANATEQVKIEDFLADPYVEALLVDGFYTPEEIDLRGFFEWSSCIPDRTWPKEASTEEATAVKMAIGMIDWMGGDCACWPAEELNKITVKYLGVALEDVILNAMVDRGGVQFPKIHYLAQYDSYYMLSPGFSYEYVQILSAWRTADGNYLVHYNGFTDSMVVILTPYEGSFRISLVMELSPNPYAPIQ